MEYIRRIVDDEIDKRTKAFNAINIVGPKGCGKTRTAKERCKTVIEFQDEELRSGYLNIAETAPIRTGYKFVGWYYHGELFDINTKINKDYVLVAKWIK